MDQSSNKETNPTPNDTATETPDTEQPCSCCQITKNIFGYSVCCCQLTLYACIFCIFCPITCPILIIMIAMIAMMMLWFRFLDTHY